MTMFEELFALATSATLTMTVSADEKTGRLTVNVIPKPKPKQQAGEPALAQPLSLTATPQEFDAEFVQALRGYRDVRQSLAQQAEATNEVIEAAKAASVKKASEATAKASSAKPAAPAKPAASASAAQPPVGDDEDADDAAAPQAAASAPVAASGESLNLFG